MSSHMLILTFVVAGGPLAIASRDDDGNCPISWHKDPFLGKVVATRSGACEEVEQALRSDYRADTSERLKILQQEMRPSFIALPKTKHGGIDTATTRYLLHRHFLRTRAWLVTGLAPDGARTVQSPTALLEVAGNVQELFEQRLNGRGLDLKEVAALAAMVENRMHQDSVERLRKAWHAQKLPNSGVVKLDDLERVLDTYMMSFIIRAPEALDPDKVSRALARVSNVYPKWNSTQAFVRATLRRVVRDSHHRQELTFADAEHVVVDLSEHYGQFESGECHELKMDLLALEGDRPGRVPIRDFAAQAVYNGKYQFGESVSYMRHLGLLDESDKSNPGIVIPNYMDSPSQFVATSDMYSVTCIDECDQLLLDVEKKAASPYVTAERLAAIVALLASETQSARSDGLPEKLRLRLNEIAVHGSNGKGGLIALHGRLFAQWLHHAFPRECPYPHPPSADYELLLPDEYGAKYGEREAYATRAEQLRYAAPTGPNTTERVIPLVDGTAQDLPWDSTEELLVPYLDNRRLLPAAVVPWLQMVCCLMLIGLLLKNAELLKSVFPGGEPSSKEAGISFRGFTPAYPSERRLV